MYTNVLHHRFLIRLWLIILFQVMSSVSVIHLVFSIKFCAKCAVWTLIKHDFHYFQFQYTHIYEPLCRIGFAFIKMHQPMWKKWTRKTILILDSAYKYRNTIVHDIAHFFFAPVVGWLVYRGDCRIIFVVAWQYFYRYDWVGRAHPS